MLNCLASKGYWTSEIIRGLGLLWSMGGPQGNQGLLGCTQFRPRDTGGAGLRILCLVLCGPLTPARGDPGALLQLGMDVLNRGELVLVVGRGWERGTGEVWDLG